MHYIDVFNGDADGICALQQLRLAEPHPGARLVTGVKRDIRLLQQLEGINNASITVLDISLDSNREGLIPLLKSGCKVLYVDHHFSGDIPLSENLTAHIDPNPETCTSLLVDRLLGGRYRPWAVVGAFGDNLRKAAEKTAASISLADDTVDKLKELGELLNYNGYGFSAEDLHFPPQELYKAVQPFDDPIDFWEHSRILSRLRQGYHDDMHLASEFEPIRMNPAGRIFELPAEPWARRVSGVFSNLKAREEPGLAHALLIRNPDGTFRVNIRAPLNNKKGADTLCLSFATGGGRAAAAGINFLPETELELFFEKFDEIFGE